MFLFDSIHVYLLNKFAYLLLNCLNIHRIIFYIINIDMNHYINYMILSTIAIMLAKCVEHLNESCRRNYGLYRWVEL